MFVLGRIDIAEAEAEGEEFGWEERERERERERGVRRVTKNGRRSNGGRHGDGESERETQERDTGWELLAMARHLIDQGKPSQALQAVVMATRAKGGDQAVIEFLQRARELYRSKLQSTSAVEQLASLFAECAIAEAQPLGGQPSNSYCKRSIDRARCPWKFHTGGNWKESGCTGCFF
ncbi:hypothetical protein NL676_025882 [Syzygium grande]|nr:hypothetical protein NL676_025882 [Syzygium grande]